MTHQRTQLRRPRKRFNSVQNVVLALVRTSKRATDNEYIAGGHWSTPYPCNLTVDSHPSRSKVNNDPSWSLRVTYLDGAIRRWVDEPRRRLGNRSPLQGLSA